MLGTIGEDKRLETTVIAGDVNVASRVEGLTKSIGAQIVISSTVEAAIAEHQKYPASAGHHSGCGSIPRVRRLRGLRRRRARAACKDGRCGRVRTQRAGIYRTELQVSFGIFDEIATRNREDLPAAYYRDRSAAKLRESEEKPVS